MFDINEIIETEFLQSHCGIDGIPCFSPKTELEISQDKYESISNNIDFYTWLAYGKSLGSIEKENVYSRVNSLLHSELSKDKSLALLDVGCGVGKTIFDNSSYFNNIEFIGFDYSFNMLKRAKQLVKNGNLIHIDLSSSGLPSFELEGKTQHNVHLVQGNACDLPFKPSSIDVVINTFLIDRVGDVAKALEQMVSVIKPGGLFVLSSPLNFQTTENWGYGNPEAIIHILKKLQIVEIEFEDNIRHCEVLDARGNTKVWNAVLIWGRKEF